MLIIAMWMFSSGPGCLRSN